MFCRRQVKTSSSSQSDRNAAVTFRRASIYIFLVIAILVVLQTAKLAKDEHDCEFIMLAHKRSRSYVASCSGIAQRRERTCRPAISAVCASRHSVIVFG